MSGTPKDPREVWGEPHLDVARSPEGHLRGLSIDRLDWKGVSGSRSAYEGR